MPQYMIAGYLPDDYDPTSETPESIAAIHALNDELEASGKLKFVCGVSHVSTARTLRKQSDGRMLVSDGPFTETKEHIGGLLLIEAADMDEVLAWAKKSADVFRGGVEVREIFFAADPKRASE